jgi:hypothetical protein
MPGRLAASSALYSGAPTSNTATIPSPARLQGFTISAVACAVFEARMIDGWAELIS